MDLSKSDIVLVKHDLGASVEGASQGPDAIYTSLVDTLFANKYVHIVEETKSFGSAGGFEHAKNIQEITQSIDTLAEKVKAGLQRNDHCLVLSGDHSTAAGTISGVKKAYPDQRIGVVWFDAHADIHSPYTTPSGNMHGMPLSAVTDQDNTLAAVRDLDEQTIQAWDTFKNTVGFLPAVLPRDIAFVGIRDLEEPETKLLSRQESLNIYAKDFATQSVASWFERISKHLADCDRWVVNFDLDCLDASEVPGTGTPVEQGPATTPITALTQKLVQHPKCCCFELSEYNPQLDKASKTLNLAKDFLTQIFA